LDNSISKHILNTHIKDGVTIYQDLYEKKNINNIKSRRGKRGYYMEALKIFTVCNSNKDNQIVTFLINNITKQMTITATTKKLADTFDVSEVKIRALIRKLKKIDFLRGSNGIYIVNPFMWIPNGIRDEILASAQSEWLYNTKKL